jgi:hypothetical protein
MEPFIMQGKLEKSSLKEPELALESFVRKQPILGRKTFQSKFRLLQVAGFQFPCTVNGSRVQYTVHEWTRDNYDVHRVILE